MNNLLSFVPWSRVRVNFPRAPFVLESGCRKWGTIPESLGLQPTCFREKNRNNDKYPVQRLKGTKLKGTGIIGRERGERVREREREDG